jgi:SAM-dependent methyltransferase
VIQLLHGDCLERLRELPDNSVDACVTDPPYGLSFMGKAWDYDVPQVDVWREVLRVLKPGGHLLAFAGTRTQHRMAVQIEDAGFEIRDMIAWVYGSGFPKSLDVSKAIDKLDASEAQQARRYRFTEWVRSTGLTAKQIDEATGTNMGGHYTTAASQPAIMTVEHLDSVRHLIGEVPEWVERECEIRSVESENFKRREVVGQATDGAGNGSVIGLGTAASMATVYDITAPATPAAQQWAGWGTALKPALEPITVARKPLVGTVAANVLEHGTGAINVDGCRVAGVKGVPASPSNAGSLGWTTGGDMERKQQQNGRWPANLIHDGSDEVVGLFPQTGVSSGGGMKDLRKGRLFQGDTNANITPYCGFGDSGSAARFFYCAKASKADRGDGNAHPTVKPTELMRYLCRLVTPPGGVVLDPFMGSGSTGKAAALEGFRFVGIEREAEYLEIARQRVQVGDVQGALL